MYDFMYAMARFVLNHILLIFCIGVAIQIFLAIINKPLWGIILPLISFSSSFYWFGSPQKDAEYPTMTGMNVIPYWILTLGYILSLAICIAISVAMKKGKKL